MADTLEHNNPHWLEEPTPEISPSKTVPVSTVSPPWWEKSFSKVIPDSDMDTVPASSLPWWEEAQATKLPKPNATPEAQYPKGERNPYHEFAKNFAAKLNGIDFSGHAEVPVPVIGRPLNSSRDQPEKQYKTLSYSEIASRDSGWKLHLNFDPENPETTKQIGTFLAALQENEVITDFKIGAGGGKAAGAPGKEATIYVGHRDKTAAVSLAIEENIGTLLNAPEGDALADDIEFTAHTMGRFELLSTDPDFYQYGFRGFPRLKSSASILDFSINTMSDEEKEQLYALASQTSEEVLTGRYNEFYTGKRPEQT